VELSGGLWNYFATALDQNAAEAGYVWPNPLVRGDAWASQLLYVFHALPIVLALTLAIDRERPGDWRTPFLISLACVGVAENVGLIRDVLRTRIPDAIVPAVVAAGWLVHRGTRLRTRVLAVVPAVLFVVMGIGLARSANIDEQLNRAGLESDLLFEPGEVPALFVERAAQLRDRFGGTPSRTAAVLHDFFLYVDRCTSPTDRLFLGGMIPEVAYVARRPFAGGGYEHYNFNSAINQERVVERLRRQVVPFAVIPTGNSGLELDADLPIVAAHFRGRYEPIADIRVADDERVQILVDRRLAPVGVDAATGWPCFK
jgi:hypothetical protein